MTFLLYFRFQHIRTLVNLLTCPVFVWKQARRTGNHVQPYDTRCTNSYRYMAPFFILESDLTLHSIQEVRDGVARTCASFSVGAGFKCWSRDWLYQLKLLVVFFSPPGQTLG